MARRRYQRGSLFQRGKEVKVWVGRWREDEMLEGTIRRVYRNEVIGSLKEYPTRRLALRELEARLSTINSPSYRARPTATFKEFSERWTALVLSQHKPSTQSAIRSQLKRHLLPLLGSISLKDFSAVTLQGLISSSKLSAKSVRNLIATLRILWNSARSWGYVIHDPFEGLVLPKAEKKQQFYFTLDEVQRILAAAPEPYRTFYWLAAETGMRAGELCGLGVDDINLENCTVQVRQSVWHGRVQSPKTSNAIRSFSISPQLAGHLREYIRGWRPNSLRLLFSTRNGTPWDANLVVKRRLHPTLRRLGINRAGLHAFRHASATLMDQHNVPMKTRQERLGHSDPRLTMGIYTHQISDDDRKFAAEVGVLLDPNCTQVAPTKEEGAEASAPTP